MGSDLAGLIPPQLFGGQPTHARDEPTLDLAQINRGVQRPPGVVEDIYCRNTVLTGKGVNGDLTDGSAVGKV